MARRSAPRLRKRHRRPARTPETDPAGHRRRSARLRAIRATAPTPATSPPSATTVSPERAPPTRSTASSQSRSAMPRMTTATTSAAGSGGRAHVVTARYARSVVRRRHGPWGCRAADGRCQGNQGLHRLALERGHRPGLEPPPPPSRWPAQRRPGAGRVRGLPACTGARWYLRHLSGFPAGGACH